MGRDGGVAAPDEEALHGARECPADLLPVLPGDLRGLGVGALAEAHRGAELVHPGHVVLGPVEVGLEDDPDPPPPLGPELLECVEGLFGVLRRLHVEADEDPLLAPLLQEALEVLPEERPPDLLAELGELEGKTGLQALPADALHELEVHVARRPAVLPTLLRLAQIVGGDRPSPGVGLPDGGQEVVEVLAPDEAAAHGAQGRAGHQRLQSGRLAQQEEAAPEQAHQSNPSSRRRSIAVSRRCFTSTRLSSPTRSSTPDRVRPRQRIGLWTWPTTPRPPVAQRGKTR